VIFLTSHLFCTKKLVDPLEEVQEIYTAIRAVSWSSRKVTAVSRRGTEVAWQEAYNRLFEMEFEKIGGWQPSPVLCRRPTHKGDFLKNDVLVEIQFGNSAAIYRDYYKFHYGFVNRLLTLAVLVIPTDPIAFFPERNRRSIINMASYEYALQHFEALTIPVPILLIGLLPRNTVSGP
jgi:Restriction endonuclease BglII